MSRSKMTQDSPPIAERGKMFDIIFCFIMGGLFGGAIGIHLAKSKRIEYPPYEPLYRYKTKKEYTTHKPNQTKDQLNTKSESKE